LGASLTILNWINACDSSDTALGITELYGELGAAAKAATANGPSRLEGMLAVQAHTLDAVFNKCLVRDRCPLPNFFVRTPPV